MYQVYCDDTLIYDPRIDSLKIVNPKLTIELNKTGSFTFTIYPSNARYNILQKMKSIITVYNDGELIFRGRILNDDERFYNQKQVSCEGELAFLLDSVVRPYDFEGSPEELFRKLIESHNEQVEETKRFKVGTVTVTDPNDYITRASAQYPTTWGEINEKLIDKLGGFLWVRHESDGIYIDYLADFDILSSQTIEFGKNLLDINKITKGENIATAIIPLGARLNESETRLTIESVNDGVDYVFDAEAVSKYGYIFKTVEWDDVTLPENLLRKAKEYLATSINLSVSIELDAFDLAGIDKDISFFKLGTYIKVQTSPHSLNANMLVKKLAITLDSPTKNKLTLGTTYSTFTETVSNSGQNQNATLHTLTNNIDTANKAIQDVSEQVTSQVAQTASEILATVSKDVYLKAESDELIESINTKLAQTNEEFEFQFNMFSHDIADVANGAEAKFQEIKKYIRFVDGNIVLGEEGNELTFKIQNNRISLLQNNAEVAYFSNRKMYVTDSEFLNSLKIGKFAFLPRENGNLSFKAVT